MYLFYYLQVTAARQIAFSLMANSHVLLIGIGLRLMKRKRHTLFALGLVGDLQTADLTGLELVDIEQIQQVLDILHAIEVTVDIQVAVFDRIRDSLRLILRRHDLARLLDRARTLVDIFAQCLYIQ